MQTNDCGSFTYAVLTSRSTTPRTLQNTLFINILVNTLHGPHLDPDDSSSQSHSLFPTFLP